MLEAKSSYCIIFQNEAYIPAAVTRLAYWITLCFINNGPENIYEPMQTIRLQIQSQVTKFK